MIMVPLSSFFESFKLGLSSLELFLVGLDAFGTENVFIRLSFYLIRCERKGEFMWHNIKCMYNVGTVLFSRSEELKCSIEKRHLM
jgi:hypothetical protein